jgi:segregation and condensation protein B
MKKRLSRSALETLSIIAYKQPVTKSELERIRGVNCDYAIQKLLEKELVAIQGRSDGPGRPLLYGTSDKFMDYFGLKSLDDLPKPKEFREPSNQIGEQAPIEEPIPVEEPAVTEHEPLQEEE